MARLSLFLDKRGKKNNEDCPVKISLAHNGKTVYLSTEIKVKPSFWNPKFENKVIKHPMADIINQELFELINTARKALREIESSRNITILDANSLKDIIFKKMFGNGKALQVVSFHQYFTKYCEDRRKKSTYNIYIRALNKIEQYLNEELNLNIADLNFEDIDNNWLRLFEKWMLKSNCRNTCNIHFRTIRAVFNDAIDNEVTSNYPFRRFKIKAVRTAKRSLSVEELRTLLNFECDEFIKPYRDIFILSFMLCGANMIDLYGLKEIRNGRIEYNRSKTEKFYSIKIEPEALEIIERHKGKNHLLSFADRYVNYVDYLRRLDKAIKKIGPYEILNGRGKRKYDPLFPDVSFYWARHTWATIAASLDIPKETIAAALGHGGNSVTDIYIDFDQRKVDEANRRVLDWVLYEKR